MDTYSAIDIHESSVKKTKLSPDGSLLAIATNRRLFVLSDTTSGKVKQTIKLTTDIEDFALSPDGKLLAMATFEGIKIFNLTSGKYLRKFMTKSTCLTFSSDGSKIFSALGAVIHVAEIAQESLITPGPSDSSRDKSVLLSTKVSISPDCKLIASVLFALEFGQLQLILKVTDINSRIFTHVLKHLHFDETDRNPRVLFSPDSRNLALVLGTMIIFWNISLGSDRVISTQKWTSYFYDAEEEDMAFSADSARFALMLCKADAYSTHNLTIQVWDSDSGKRLMHIGQRRNSYTKGGACISFSPDSQRLAISWLDENCNNKTIRVEIWEIASNSAVQVIDLDYYYSNNHVSISSPSPVFARPPGEEYQRDEKVDTASIEAKFRGPVAGVIEWSFFGEGLLMLDLRFEAEDSYIRQDAVPANTYLRITLRTRTDLDLTGQASSMARFREAKVYDIDTEQTWIEFCGTRLVWVPPQYRYVAQDSLGNCVAFTREDESLCIIQFQRDKLATKTYLPELPNNCGFVYRDMNPPDNKLLEKIGKIDRVKEPLSVVSQKAMRDLRRGINLQLYKLWNKYSS
jgi:WD40 repeat protein